jgi:hypothetical protein
MNKSSPDGRKARQEPPWQISFGMVRDRRSRPASLSWACNPTGGRRLQLLPPTFCGSNQSGFDDQSGHRPSPAGQHSDGGELGTGCRGWPDATVLAKAGPRARGRHSRSTLRPNVRFSDGTPVRRRAIANILPESLKSFSGPIASDLEGSAVECPIVSNDVQALITVPPRDARKSNPAPRHAAIRYRTLRRCVRLDDIVQGNASYYLGKPSIENINVTTYQTVAQHGPSCCAIRSTCCGRWIPTRSIR